VLAKTSIHALVQLVEERLSRLSLVDAADRRYLRELTGCRDELLRDLLREDDDIVDARMIGRASRMRVAPSRAKSYPRFPQTK
jgi:hypothetical protein